jgi:hypothetical protein
MGNAVKDNTWPTNIVVSRTQAGGPPPMQKFPVAASQTIYAGNPVEVNSSGELLASGATPTTGVIAGVAAEDVTTTAADEKTECNIVLALPGTIFRMRGEAATSTIDEGETCMINVSTKTVSADLNSSGGGTAALIRIVQKVRGDDETDASAPGRVDFIFNKTCWGNATP